MDPKNSEKIRKFKNIMIFLNKSEKSRKTIISRKKQIQKIENSLENPSLSLIPYSIPTAAKVQKPEI